MAPAPEEALAVEPADAETRAILARRAVGMAPEGGFRFGN
jgi:hypothetical protein